ncbi:hypothetical protein BDA99DRAFT_513583 [Phascolomyces articulosus]|uniref:Adhesin domain-containing protein n=1 Tax=Phascolomyces articulosus TaxID=60185 RepID=A0AAD5JXV3_9FUNG|nr:hypothetical protein BDA99DRAFT_513583 [Phascolomyces articulosus]
MTDQNDSNKQQEQHQHDQDIASSSQLSSTVPPQSIIISSFKRRLLSLMLFSVLPLLLCWCYWYNIKIECSEICSVLPSIPWSETHYISPDRFHKLRIDYENSNHLHVIDGLVHVKRNDQIKDIIIKFNFKLENPHRGLLIWHSHTEDDDIVTLTIKNEQTIEPLCALMDIDVELPSSSALDELVIETPNSNIQIDEGMYFSKRLKLNTIDANITVTNSGSDIIEIDTKSGFINGSFIEETLGDQLLVHSNTGNITFEYTDVSTLVTFPLSDISERQRRKKWISLTSISGEISTLMCTEYNLLFDALYGDGTFGRFSGFGISSDNSDRLKPTDYKSVRSRFYTHHQGMWGSRDNIDIHLITKIEMGSFTWIRFCCLNGCNKKKL